MTVRIPPPDALVVLFERLAAMASAIENAGSLEHRRGAAAARHFEFEVLPLLSAMTPASLTDVIVEASIDEHHRLNGSRRVSMSLSSGNVRCPPGGTMQITARCTGAAMKIERIVIPDEIAPYFNVHDIRIANRSQLEQDGAIPGEVFAQNAPDPRPITYDVARTGQDIILIVEYIGGATGAFGDADQFAFDAAAIGISPARGADVVAWINTVTATGEATAAVAPLPGWQDANVEGRVMGVGSVTDPVRTPLRPANSARVVATSPVTPRR